MPGHHKPEITWQELIEDADLVVVVTYLEQLLPEKKLTGWLGGKGIDQFRIDNILKGNIERETIELPTWYGVEVLSGNRYGVYPVCNPPYITGQKYLLVLKKTMAYSEYSGPVSIASPAIGNQHSG